MLQCLYLQRPTFDRLAEGEKPPDRNIAQGVRTKKNIATRLHCSGPDEVCYFSFIQTLPDYVIPLLQFCVEAREDVGVFICVLEVKHRETFRT